MTAVPAEVPDDNDDDQLDEPLVAMPGLGARVLENLSEEEAYLWAILQDASGLDAAEFATVDEESEDGCWRAWPFQYSWFRCMDLRQVDQNARSTGKSLSIQLRVCVFPFIHPGGEMVITAPEGIHVDAITERIEAQITATRLVREMIIGGRNGINHRPWKVRFRNGARVISRIPQRTGVGIKGTHPVVLEQDEACFPAGTLILSERGQVPIEDLTVGDRVLTHLNRWREVTAVFDRGVRDTVVVRGQGHPGLICTPNHPFWAREVTKWQDVRRRWGALSVQAPDWCPAEGMGSAFWASPASFETIQAPAAIPRSATGASYAVPVTTDFMWVLGLYLAEGSTSNTSPRFGWTKASFSVHVDEVPHVIERLRAAGIKSFPQPVQNTVNCMNVVVSHAEMARFLSANCGQGARNKEIPLWVFGMAEEDRRAFLEGLCYGDGNSPKDPRYKPGRWQLATSSKRLAVSSRLLALSLGYSVSMYRIKPPTRPRFIRGKRIFSGESYTVVGNVVGQGIVDPEHRWTRVRAIKPAEPANVYDIEVADDHSFVAEGIVVHNSDYPAQGWTELRETLKRDVAGASWRAHGVSRGIPDEFYKITQPDSGWTTHHYTAYHKPTWTDQERKDKIREYGSVDDPDYRRNILGVHGDATNAIFVLSALMSGVDTAEASDYNLDEYHSVKIKIEQVADRARPHNIPPEHYGQVLAEMLELPERHRQSYKVFWVGMDIGIVQDPSAIMVFAEHELSAAQRKADKAAGLAVPAPGVTQLKLLARLEMLRIPVPVQAEALLAVIEFYRPRAVSLDSTGNGLGILQVLQQQARRSKLMMLLDAGERPWGDDPDGSAAAASAALTVIKGYNFGSKIVVAIDEEKASELGPHAGIAEVVEKAGIRKQAKEWSTDQCRLMVDTQRWRLPMDRSLLAQLNGQTYTYSQAQTDAYGNRTRVYSRGEYHCLVAGTAVRTSTGEVPIEAVTPGMLVATRDGWKPVLDAWQTAEAAPVMTVEFSTGATLTGTPEHKIWTSRGWVEIGRLLWDDEVVAWSPSVLCSTAGRSIGTPSRSDARTGFTSVAPRALAVFTKKCGSFTGGLSQRGGTSTTSMATRSIARLRTSSASAPKRTLRLTTKRIITSISERQPTWHTWLRSARPQQRGTARRRDERGTASMGSGLGRVNRAREFVSSVTQGSSQRRRLFFAPPVASSDRTLPTIPNRARCRARNVGLSSRAFGPANARTVVTVVCITPVREPQAVYDLTIADAHEFFADGILVHNSFDGIRQAILGMVQHPFEALLKTPPKKAGPVLDIFWG